ncbi:hypothetical protein J7E96_25280 [Streptomyces sp. ISL-96]|uniref:hypothetical protein n=1 Tax=unclassified Streptomyces TaxID=2593676 RepID=UPI001BE65EB5|nr:MULTISPECIES: hypothetical protein [unclassified Streptomyces]MBT2399714.1 hypothetical protein [Streptomyces sp. ISL-100]MBT2491781.1 hypothetical protein [Streptomyces sp. ISL-96]
MSERTAFADLHGPPEPPAAGAAGVRVAAGPEWGGASAPGAGESGKAEASFGGEGEKVQDLGA